MARQRRNVNLDSNKVDKGTNSSSSNGSITTKQTKPQKGIMSYWKHGFGFLCLSIAISVGYLGYLETRVNTPYDNRKVSMSLLIQVV